MRLIKLTQMAIYNKRGYKTPKPKEEKDTTDLVEDTLVNEKESTTAGVFNTLDESANKAEDWIVKNQKIILSLVGGIAFLVIGYLLYDKYVVEPKENEAADEMFVAQDNFKKAVEGGKNPDSLYNLALNGAEGKFGFIKIIDQFSGTDAANLAHYYAGICYLNLGKNTEAIEYLDKFNSEDMFLSALAKGAIGDAFAQKNQMKEALEYYEKAARMNENDITTPRFLLKAGQTAYTLGKKDVAKTYFTEIKEKYDLSQEARNIDGLIGLSQ